MSYELNSKIKDLVPYMPINGSYKVRLDANESFIKLPLALRLKIIFKILSLKFNRYPDPTCFELCRAFIKANNLDDEEVVAGNGSDELISVITSAFLKKGENMLTLDPDFSMYNFYSQIYEANCLTFPKDKDFSAKNVISFVKQNNIKLLIFSNPCNPTSLLIPRNEIEEIIKNTDALVIVDEAYMDFTNENNSSFLSSTLNYDNVIVLKTLSKAYGLAGIRLGFAVGNKTLINAIRAVKSPYNVNSITQIIGEIVISNAKYLQKSLVKINNSTLELIKGINDIIKNNDDYSALKTNTNFVFINTKHAKRIYNDLKEKSIVVRQMGDNLRICAGNKRENKAFLTAFSDICNEIKED